MLLTLCLISSLLSLSLSFVVFDEGRGCAGGVRYKPPPRGTNTNRPAPTRPRMYVTKCSSSFSSFFFAPCSIGLSAY
ncbi:hypothetical protein DFJ73DRAFT_875060 [Zopfochytrium polystomum]|nr:hypothetical protein DFJ73DRAFT_875060 [Zopfochytrium polystomum]